MEAQLLPFDGKEVSSYHVPKAARELVLSLERVCTPGSWCLPEHSAVFEQLFRTWVYGFMVCISKLVGVGGLGVNMWHGLMAQWCGFRLGSQLGSEIVCVVGTQGLDFKVSSVILAI
jgi:hypothetical protein